MKDIVDSFKFPSRYYKSLTVPTKALQTIYQNITSQRDKALFLIYATSGLNSEVINLRIADVNSEKGMANTPKGRKSVKTCLDKFL